VNVLTGRANNSTETRAAPTGPTRFDFSRSALQAFQLCVLRGRTGCGKTSVLNALATLGCQTLDLERLARHRGSAFGAVGMQRQPSHTEFLQRLHVHWEAFDQAAPLFVEFAGGYLGSLAIPLELAQQIHRTDWIKLVATESHRAESIAAIYAGLGQQRLLAATKRLRGRFPPESLARVRKAIRQQRYQDAVCLLLPYYDAAYDHQMEEAEGRCLFTLDVNGLSPLQVAAAILHKLELTEHAAD